MAQAQQGGKVAMLPIALNHVTVPGMGFDALMTLAKGLGCSGVELRNDLTAASLTADAVAQAASAAKSADIRILALAEVKSFNEWSDAKAAEADALMGLAAQCGAECVSLIPRNDGMGLGNGERQAKLRIALRELKPMLEAHDLIGLVEPLGFEHCSMQYKSEAVEIIEALNAEDRIKLVHDTFHHHLAGGGPVFAAHTGMVHVSGVTDPSLSILEMADEHRALVDGRDRLGNLDQIEQLIADGYAGPISMEAFAPSVHAFTDPKAELSRSFDFIASRLAEMAA